MHMHSRTRSFRSPRLILLAAMVSLGLVACAEDGDDRVEIEEAQARSDIETNLEAHLGGLSDATAFLGSSEVACGAADAVSSPTAESIEPTDTCTALALESDLDSLIQMLRERVFIESNILERTEKRIRYGLDPSRVCTDGGEGDIGLCNDLLGFMPMMVDVSQTAAGDLDLDLVVGDHTLATVELYRDHLAVEVDLGRAIDAMESLAREEDPSFAFDGRVSGRLRAELTRHSATDYELGVGLVSDLRVDVAVPEAGRLALSADESFPMLSTRIDSETKELGLGIDLDAVDVSMPGNLFGSAATTCSFDPATGDQMCDSDSSGIDGMIDLHFGGANGTLILDVTGERIELTGIGMGDESTTLAIDGERVVELDMNAASGRTFDATITPAESGALQIAVRPSAELVARMTMARVADQVSGLSQWALDDVLGLSFSGESPTLVLDGSRVEVVSGALRLTSERFAAVEVGPGQCLTYDAPVDPSHPFDGYGAGECLDESITEPTEPVPTP